MRIFFMPDFSVRRICMDKKIFNAELRYYTVIRLAKKMLAEGQISPKEYSFLKRKMEEKYRPYLTKSAV